VVGKSTQAKKSNLVPRPPVVTVMGHIDHGKTTLLDAIRKTNVVGKEFGGITQHIGAYQAEIKLAGSQEKRKITFIDTPGHEAFTKMRARGAQVTDIAVLVVAADDGVMPQTREAISHIKAADVPLVVAINKIDIPGVEPEKVKKQLVESGVLLEKHGGDVPVVEVSAKEGKGVNELLEMVLLVTDLKNFTADETGPFQGVIIESHLDNRRGSVGTVLVKNGTLKTGAEFLVGGLRGKVRAMTDDRGRKIDFAGPSVPVEVIGFNEVPEVGVMIGAVGVGERGLSQREDAEFLPSEETEKEIQAYEKKVLKIILRTDVEGTREAVVDRLKQVKPKEVRVKVVLSGTGSICDSDIFLAKATGGIVVGFNAGLSQAVSKLAEMEGVEVRLYKLIYELLEDLSKRSKKLLVSEGAEEVLGKGEIVAEFEGTKVRIAGVKVTDGVLRAEDRARIVRGEKVIGEGKIATMRHLKKDIQKSEAGRECGVTFSDEGLDFKVGDVVECYRTRRKS
jgi:translation initiation factor IF-2